MSALAEVQEAFRTLPERYLGAEPGFDATYHVRLGDIGRTLGGPLHHPRRPRPRRARPGASRRRRDRHRRRHLAAACARASSPASRRSRSAGSTPAATSTSRSASRACSASPTAARRCCASTTSPLGTAAEISHADDGRGPRRAAPARPRRDQASLLRHRRGAQPAATASTRSTCRASAAPPSPRWRPYGAPFFARAVIGAMDALGIERAHLVGNSMGGRVAIEVGLSEPGPRRRARAALPRGGVRAPRLAPARALRRAPSSACSPTRSAAGGSSASSGRCSPTATSSTRAWPTSSSTSSSASTARAGARLAFLASARAIYLEPPFGRGGFYPRLAALEPPAMFVWASHDKLIPPGFRRHVERWLPSAEQIVLEGCGHVPQVERPERTNGLLERFFARDRRAGRLARCGGVTGSPPMTATATRNGHGAPAARRRSAPAGVGGRSSSRPRPRRRPRRARPRLHPREPPAPVAARLAVLPRRGARARQRARGGPGAARRQPLRRQPDARHGRLHARLQHLLRGRARLPPARPQPRALDARAVVPAQVRHGRRLAGERPQGARRPAPRCSSTPAATTRSTARAGSATASTSAAARASSGSRSTQDVPIVPVVVDRRAGDRAVPLARRAPRQGPAGSTGCSA